MSNVKGGRYDDIEIIYRHCDVVISKIENLNILLGPDSIIAAQFRRKTGKAFINYMKQYYEAKERKSHSLPKAPTGNGPTDFLKNIIPHLFDPYAIIRYAFQWCQLARWQLLFLANTMSDFDIRWNQLLTTRFCQIFTTYCRVAISFHHLPLIKPVSDLCPLIEIPNLEQYLYESDKISKFVDECYADPFKWINKILNLIRDKLNRLTVTLSTYVASLFGQFPLIDWNVFSIFSKPTSQPESTLPSDDFYIFENINLLKYTLIFFVCIFPDITKENESFNFIIENLLSESPVIPITPTIRLKIDEFLHFSKSEIFSDDTLNFIPLLAKRKFNTGHIKRIQNINVLLDDIINMCKYDASIIPQKFSNIISLCGLGYYELDQYFTYDINSPEALELLTSILEIIKLIETNEEDIKRFYIYNLSTIDLEFLKIQLKPLDESSPISMKLSFFVKALEMIKIEEYDADTKYCFESFFITFGRVLCDFNRLKQNSISSYAEPIFEHMTTIINHINYATKPLETFFEICPIHSLWYHSNRFIDHINDKKLKLSKCLSFLNIFKYFNRSSSIYMYPKEIVHLTDQFTKIKKQLYERLIDDIKNKIMNNELFIKSSNQMIDFTPKEIESILVYNSNLGYNAEMINEFVNINQVIIEVQKCLIELPLDVSVFGKKIQTFDIFEEGILKSLDDILFSDKIELNTKNLYNNVNVTFQVLWPIYVLINKPFQREVFRSLLKREMLIENQTFLEKANLLNNKNEITNNGLTSILSKKLLEYFENGEYLKHLYFEPLKSFYSLMNIGYTLEYFQYLITYLGVYPNLYLLSNLYQIITNSILNIFNNFELLTNEIPIWYNEFQKSNLIPIETINNKTIENSGLNLIKVGVSIVLCSLIKESIRNKSEEAIPGIKNIIEAAKNRMNLSLNEKEFLLLEITSDNSIADNHFLKNLIVEKDIKKQIDFAKFMFFIGLVFNHNRWNNIQCISMYGAITENLNLIPICINEIIDSKDTLFVTQDDFSIQLGLKTFLRTIQQIVSIKRTKGNIRYVNAIYKIMENLPKQISCLQVGLVDEQFPNISIIDEDEQLGKKKRK